MYSEMPQNYSIRDKHFRFEFLELIMNTGSLKKIIVNNNSNKNTRQIIIINRKVSEPTVNTCDHVTDTTFHCCCLSFRFRLYRRLYTYKFRFRIKRCFKKMSIFFFFLVSLTWEQETEKHWRHYQSLHYAPKVMKI